MSEWSGEATHAGGVVYRERGGGVEYLLVRSTGPQREWVLPKGHIEAGESARAAAVREVKEEAQVEAELMSELDTVEYTLRDQHIRVRFYLMRELQDSRGAHVGRHGDEERERAWLPLEQAQASLVHDAHGRLLELAERKRRGT